MHCSSKVHVSTRTESVYICAGLNLSVPTGHTILEASPANRITRLSGIVCAAAILKRLLSGSSNLVFASSTGITREWLSEVTCKLWEGKLLLAILIHQQWNLLSLSCCTTAIFNLTFKIVFLWIVNLSIQMRCSLHIPSAFIMWISKFSIN